MSEARLSRDVLDTVGKLVRRTFRYWWAAVIVVVLGAPLAFGVAKIRKYRYTSEAVVLYQQGMSFNLSQNEGVTNSRRLGQRLRDVVLARTNLTKLIQELDLADVEDKKKTGNVIEELRQDIKFRINDGDTFVISYTAPQAKLAQAVTAKITDMLIAQNQRLSADQAEIAREFIDVERKRTEDNLRTKETELARFLSKHPEFAAEQSGQSTTGAAIRATRGGKVGEPSNGGDSVISALRREEARLKQQLANPGAVVSAAPTVDPALAAAIRDAEGRLAIAKRELTDRRARFTEQHPDVRAAAASVRDAEDALKKARDAAAADTGEQVMEIEPRAALQARLAQVQAEIRRRDRGGAAPGDPTAEQATATSDAATRIVAIETEWARVNRELNEARERYQALDVRQFAASIAESSLASGQSSRIVVIDPAYLPESPSGASPKRMLIVGVAASVLVGMLIALGLALIDDHVYDRDDIERFSTAQVLVEVPVFRKGGRRV